MADMLIIDYDRQMRRLPNRILTGAGHTVREAENGRDGVALFGQQRSAVVITDIVMPDMGGSRRSSIIAISGGSDPLYLQAAGKLGATAVLRKPFSPDKLITNGRRDASDISSTPN